MNAPPLQFSCAGHSVVGRRSGNQDAYFMQPRLGLFVVADGMGGYAGGEVASGIVVHTLHDFFHNRDLDADVPRGDDEGRLDALVRSVDAGLRLAHREVSASKRGPLHQMGSTALVVVLRHRALVVGNLGDCRLYRLRGDVLTLLTTDHSVAEELLAGTKGTPAYADGVAERYRHCLTRAVGMAGEPDGDVSCHPIAVGDRYLLCSDGLWGVLEPITLATALSDETPLLACDRLIETAYAAHSSDNITAVVVDVHAPGTIP